MLLNVQLSLSNLLFPAVTKDINLNYTACNRYFVELSGISSEKELIGKSDIHFIWGQKNPDNAYNYYSDDINVLNSKTLNVRIEHIIFYNKTVVARTLKLPILNNYSKIAGILIIFLDVSEDISKKDINKVISSYNTITEQKAYFNTISKKVVHDIQSNLSTLSILTSTNQEQADTNTFKLINSTVSKIKGTLEVLLESQKNLNTQFIDTSINEHIRPEISSQKQKKTTIILSLFLFTIIQEKLIEYKELNYHINLQYNLSEESFYTLINIDEVALSRSISNLLNNAARAAKNSKDKTITICLKKNELNIVYILIKNKGDRIPQEVLEYLNYSAAIPSSSIINQGLGLKQVKEMVKKNKASIFAQTNSCGSGCIIKLGFNAVSANWLKQSMQITQNSFIILLYNNNDIFKAFKHKLDTFSKEHKIDIKITYFKDASELIYCIANASKELKKDIILFVETDFTNKQYYFEDLLNRINIKNINLITTSYQYKKSDIATNSNIKILPKLFINDLYLYSDTETLVMSKNKADIVIIDDDENFLYAIKNFFFKNKNVDTYLDTSEFINNIDSYNYDTIICIDNTIKFSYGLDFAKSLYQRGFTKLFILTGSNKEDIIAPSYITVLNKLHDIHLLKTLVS